MIKKKRQVKLFLMLFPFLILLALFTYVPLYGWGYAFVKYVPGKSIFNCTWVGLQYFKYIFSDYSADFARIMRNTLALSGLSIICTVIPVITAIMLSMMKLKNYSRFIQTIIAIPYFISWVLVYSVVFFVLASENSAFNSIMINLGIINRPVNFLANTNTAWINQTLINMWKNVGYNTIIYISAMSSISQDLYEAADIDGASRLQKIIHITIPGIISTYLVLLMLAVSNMLSNGFDQYYLFANGNTINKLDVFDTYVYRMGIGNGLYSLSTAFGIFKSVVSIIILSAANGISKLLRDESMF